MQLKSYQQRTLASLRDYFRACEKYESASLAFTAITERVFGQGLVYTPVKELPGLPYVCLRIPTGGGKTLVAAHAVGVAAGVLLHSESPVVLWLVPSNAIKEQTLKALRERTHPYRQAIEEAFEVVTVLDAGEALVVQANTLACGATIIVSTMQAFRVEDTEGRKVYEQSGLLMGHFENLAEKTMARLERYENGKPIPSLANVLRLHRPVVIVDEAHNARTGLSFETLRRFEPACILEFTATPDRVKNPSNVLHSVSAAELKTEDMIKLPIRLETHLDWHTVIADAVAARNGLEALAQSEQDLTGEYIRPIMLLQAQPRYKDHESLTVEVVERCLLGDNRIPAEQIRRATGEDNQIEGVDLLSPDCKVRYIITVQALREGWDCPFAYVLCSVAEAHSATAVEQILGRVLRLPHTRQKRYHELNMAYAFAASENFISTANALSEALVQHGFEKQEVKDLIVPNHQNPVQEPIDFGPLFHWQGEETISIPVTESPHLEQLSADLARRLPYDPAELARKIEYDPVEKVVKIKEPLNAEEYYALRQSFNNQEDREAVRNVDHLVRPQKAAEPSLHIPMLCYRQGDLLAQLEGSHIREAGWTLQGREAGLTEIEFPTDPAEGQQYEIDITKEGKIQKTFLAEMQMELQLLDADRNWQDGDLVSWLDQNIRHEDLEWDQTIPFLSRMVQSLRRERGLTLDVLVKERYRLKQAAEAKIEEHRQMAMKQTFLDMLNVGEKLVVTPERCFQYDPDPMKYPYTMPGALFSNQHTFHKHLYPIVGDLRPGSEEYRCAQEIDTLREMQVWVRNLDSRPKHSFWLPTSTDRFYPDFVCQLKDGRYLVVEYKGEHLWSNEDSEEKRLIGAVWEKRSEGQCLFVMPKGMRMEEIRAKIK